MTICIAAHGQDAGRAILNALSAVEAVGSGAIGGFVSAVALNSNQLLRAETQLGGTCQLAFEQSKGLFERASIAGLISSGPNRPTPLSDFLPAIPGVGLVTGHRSPSSCDASRVPFNLQVLQGMQAGMTSRAAVDAIVSSNPGADAGFIAMTCDGVGFAGNTDEVQKRPDIGSASAQRNDANVLVMHNAITPVYPMAELAAQIALETLSPLYAHTTSIYLQEGCEIVEGFENTLRVDDQNRVRQMVVCQVPDNGAAVLNMGFQPAVYREDIQIGVLLYEPYLVVSDGRLNSANGLPTIELSVGCV